MPFGPKPFLERILKYASKSMTTKTQLTLAGLHMVGLENLRKRWGWFLALGVLLIVLGTVALGSSVFMTLATMVFVGWLMIGGGVMESIHAFTVKDWGGFFMDLLSGILYVVVGFMIVANPGATALALTLLIAMFLIFGGIFRIGTAAIIRFPNWIWLLLHGVVNLLLGIAIWRQFPLSGLWVIGLFVGIDMIFNGWSLVMLGLAAKRIPDSRSECVNGAAPWMPSRTDHLTKESLLWRYPTKSGSGQPTRANRRGTLDDRRNRSLRLPNRSLDRSSMQAAAPATTLCSLPSAAIPCRESTSWKSPSRRPSEKRMNWAWKLNSCKWTR